MISIRGSSGVIYPQRLRGMKQKHSALEQEIQGFCATVIVDYVDKNLGDCQTNRPVPQTVIVC